jgi:PAS domain S-box-containing protein
VLYAEFDFGDIEATRRHFSLYADHLNLNVVLSGAEALTELRRQEVEAGYDVFLLAHHLPELHALEVLKELRLAHKLSMPTVLVCPARDEELARQAIKLGAASYVLKTTGYLHMLPWELEEAHSRAELTQREAALQVSQERYRLATGATGVGVWDWNLETGEVVVDPALKSLLGYEDHELRNHVDDWLKLVHPDDAEMVNTAAQDHVDGKTPHYEVEYRLLHKDGRIRWFLARGNAIRDEANKPVRVVGTATDISDRRQAEEAIRQRDQLLQAMFHSLSSHVVVLDRNGAITYAGKSWERFAASTAPFSSVAVGVNYLDVCRRAAGEDNAPAREALKGMEAVLNGTSHGFTIEYPFDPPGDARWFIMQVDPMPPEHGGIVISFTDITQRKLAEEALEKALGEVRQLKDQLDVENIYLREEISGAHDFGEIIGRGQALERVLRLAEQVAPLTTTVLILGETGTGKELLAHAIHNLSPRRDRSLVKVNCATLPAQLIESELFGHERGAFTGAAVRRIGRFEIANGGTIFLDEVGDLPLDLQTKLLRVLQEGEFEHLGSSRSIRVDVRILAATNRNLEQAVREGSFRSDLYYRLNIFPITLPPLRQRRDDIPLLVRHFVKELSLKLGKQIQAIPQETMNALQEYQWPGNIRELKNVIERAAIITQGPNLLLREILGSRSLQAEPAASGPLASGPLPSGPLPSSPFAIPPATGQPHPTNLEGRRGETHRSETLQESQYNLIVSTLEKTYWRLEGPDGAAALLNIHPNTLRARMKKLGITRPKFKTKP